jgi:hypothetical protein
MAKSQLRGTREKKKPKAESKVKVPSAYKQQFGAKPLQTPITQAKKPG